MGGTDSSKWFVNGEVLVYAAGGIVTEEALGIRDDKIIFVGSNAAARAVMPDDAATVDLAGRTVMPGLHDAHMHGRRRGIDGVVPSSCDLGYEGGTVEQILAKLKRALESDQHRDLLQSEYLFIATNLFGPAVLPSGTSLTRDDLDRLSQDPADDEFGAGTTRPILVIDKGVHSKFANSIAIANAGLRDGDPALADDGHVGVDENGRPNGVFNDFDGEWGPQVPAAAEEDYLERLADLAEANRLGITSLFEAAGTPESPAAWARAAAEGRLTARVNQSINATGWVRGNTDPTDIAARLREFAEVRARYDGIRSEHSPGTITIDTVKVFADGEAEYPHQTAAMLEPYNENVGTPEEPVWQRSTRIGDNPSASDAREGFLALDRAGWNIHVHCLGDRSTRETLDNFEAMVRANPAWDRRHTICHLTYVHPDDVPRLAALGIIGNMSLQWARRDAWSVDAAEGYIDREMIDRAYPARELLDAGIVLSGGSDWPVDPLNPWLQMQSAVTRGETANAAKGVYEGALAPEQAITAEEAVIMHTLGGAIQMHQDDVTGSIEVGKFADLIVLDKNPIAIDPAEIASVTVIATLLGGELVAGELPA